MLSPVVFSQDRDKEFDELVMPRTERPRSILKSTTSYPIAGETVLSKKKARLYSQTSFQDDAENLP